MLYPLSYEGGRLRELLRGFAWRPPYWLMRRCGRLDGAAQHRPGSAQPAPVLAGAGCAPLGASTRLEPPWLSRRILTLGKRGCGYAYTEDVGCSFDEEVLG